MFKNLLKVFTRQYKRDIEYYDFIDNSESIETEIEHLTRKNNYEEVLKYVKKILRSKKRLQYRDI